MVPLNALNAMHSVSGAERLQVMGKGNWSTGKKGG